MLHDSHGFSGFSVPDLQAAKQFYADALGLVVEEDRMGLHLHLGGGTEIFVYTKEDHQPATFTILNFVVDDIDSTVDEMTAKGIVLERYDNLPAPADEKGILRGRSVQMGPDIAWFKDPGGNILSVLQN